MRFERPSRNIARRSRTRRARSNGTWILSTPSAARWRVVHGQRLRPDAAGADAGLHRLRRQSDHQGRRHRVFALPVTCHSISQPLIYQWGLLEISNIRRPSPRLKHSRAGCGWEGLAISGHPVPSTSLWNDFYYQIVYRTGSQPPLGRRAPSPVITASIFEVTIAGCARQEAGIFRICFLRLAPRLAYWPVSVSFGEHLWFVAANSPRGRSRRQH
jgi:hypothetical protein